MKLKIKKISLFILTLALGLVAMLGLSTTKVFANENQLVGIITTETDEISLYQKDKLDLRNESVYLNDENIDSLLTIGNDKITLELEFTNPGNIELVTRFEPSGKDLNKNLEKDTDYIVSMFINVNTITSEIVYSHIGTDSSDIELHRPGMEEYYPDFVYFSGFSLYFLDTTDNQRPVIDGKEVFVTNVDDAKPIEFFKSMLKAYDETDGDVTDRIWIETDNYTQNMNVLGLHEVVFGVDDFSNNQTFFTAYIQVADVTAPTIIGDTKIAEIGYEETYNIETFRKSLNASDNYDTLTNADIKLLTDNYTANKGKLGTYDVVFELRDKSGNKTTFIKKVKVIDNVAPKFSGPTVISTSNNTILTESDVRARLTATDGIDNNVTAKIKLEEDNFTGNGNKVGTYTIKYSVTDNAGNTAYHIVTIERIDKIPPVIWIEDGTTIITNPDIPLTLEQIIEILKATGQINVSSQTNFTVLVDEYTGNEEQVGLYNMSIKARSTNGNESIHNLFIRVASTDDGGIDVNPDFDLGIWFKDNYVYVIVGAIALLGVGFLVYKTKRRKRR